MDALIDVLLAFIAQETSYDVAGLKPPVVIEVPRTTLTRQFYKGRAHMIPEDGVEDRLNALYVAGKSHGGTILIVPADLVAGADAFADPHDNPLWQEILLHELVHHAQHARAEESWSCVAQSEAEAYTVGGKFLETLGAPDPMTNRNVWADLYEAC